MAKVDIEESELELMKKSIADSLVKIEDLNGSMGRLTDNNTTLLEEKRKAKEATQAAIEETARKNNDYDALESSYNTNVLNVTVEKDAEIGSRDAIIAKMTSGSAAMAMANEIAIDGCVDAVLPHIKGRLTTEIVNGEAELKILDVDGKPSAITLEELKTEIENLPFLATVIKGSNASGNGNLGNGDGNPTGKKFSELTGAELKVIRDKDVAEYDRLKKEHDAGI